MKKVKNRWLIAICALGVHLSIGSAYAWSIFSNPISEQLGWSDTHVSLAFSIAIFFLGSSAAFAGRFVEKHGPKKSGMLSAVLFGVGIIGTGLAISTESLILLYLFYGVIGGMGLGIGYITPVSTLMKWFPDKPGFATGLAVMGFGFAALLTGPVAAILINKLELSYTFYILGTAYFLIMILSAQYLSPPPRDWVPKGLSLNEQNTAKKVKRDTVDFTVKEALKSRRFWVLWFILFLNITCGVAILSAASPMAMKMTGMSTATAATMVGIMGIFNGGGRLAWATISDYIGRPNVFIAFFMIQIAAFLILPLVGNISVFMILVFIIITCYGGGFSSIPAYIGDVFGKKQLDAILGYMLTAWAIAGVVGPLLLSTLYNKTGNYNLSMIVFAMLCLIALGLSVWLRHDIKQLRRQKHNVK